MLGFWRDENWKARKKALGARTAENHTNNAVLGFEL